jgi:hypothetical protein
LANLEVNQSAVNFKKNSAYTVKLKELEFEGPLDLLLFLVKKAEIDINDISISEITSQYLSYLSLLMDMDLDNISEFIEMAATLIYIKSRSLIPVEHDYEEDEQDPRDELIQRLLEYQKYNAALQIDNDSDLFIYGMKTNVGNAFVYGDLKAVDYVTYPEIGGQYSYVEKVKERYTRHTRTVTKTKTVNGKQQTYTETEEYWTWDVVDRESKSSTKITFLDVEFDYGTINFPSSM